MAEEVTRELEALAKAATRQRFKLRISTEDQRNGYEVGYYDALTAAHAEAAELLDILRAVKAETMGEPVGGGDGGTYVVRPISGATYNRIVAALQERAS